MKEKIIFLDIDGVLNSRVYDRERTLNDGNIDPTRLPLLREIVERTEAKIVLSSSWRKHWDKAREARDAIGEELNETFSAAGLEIYDKTPVIGDRAKEISAWLKCHPEVYEYVIFDDIFGGWGEHEGHLVKTSPLIGRGLTEKHVSDAIRILS